VEWVRKSENQKDIAYGEKDAAPKRKLGEEQIKGDCRTKELR
jgi:hypothetical protein